ncbi:translation initiation factor eIF4A [Gamsiella multidivaricata]|nr:translation initiation factor eIF4A [Gamsiella multidivaricata]
MNVGDIFGVIDITMDSALPIISSFEQPFATQRRSFLPILKSHDVIIHDHAGTGKTIASIISMLNKLDLTNSQCQALVIVPTRELAQATMRVVEALGKFMSVECQVCIGGTRIPECMANLAQGAQVVVGTPGRVYDMICRGALKTDSVKMLILDEADELLERFLIDQICDLLAKLRLGIQIVLMCPTMPENVMKLVARCMRDPVRFLVSRDEVLLERTKHFYIDVVNEERKLYTLLNLHMTALHAVVYCSTPRMVDWLVAQLRANNFTALAIYGDMEEEERQLVLKKARAAWAALLVSTDLEDNRRLNLQQGVTATINYDMPLKEDYIRRINQRTYRNRVFCFITSADARMIKEIEEYYLIRIQKYLN